MSGKVDYRRESSLMFFVEGNLCPEDLELIVCHDDMLWHSKVVQKVD